MALLLATVVGSDIMGETLAGGNIAVTLLGKTIVTGAILGALRFRLQSAAWIAGLFITAGYWFTASTFFAHPAVSIAQFFTHTFSGILPAPAPGFILAQFGGAVAAVASWVGCCAAK